MGSIRMILIPSFIKIGSSIQTLMVRNSQKHRSNKFRFVFFQNKEKILKTLVKLKQLKLNF
jgi:hypothetical protein